MKPISPGDLLDDIPEYVIDIINKLIKQRYRRIDRQSIILQEEIITNIISVTDCLTEDDIKYSGWLDFENIYRDAGWTVVYKKLDWALNKVQYTFTKPTKE